MGLGEKGEGIKKKYFSWTQTTTVITRGKGSWEKVMEADLTWGGEHTTQYIDDVLQNCTAKTYIILLINVTLINSI